MTKILEIIGFALIGGTIYSYLGMIGNDLRWPVFWGCAEGGTVPGETDAAAEDSGSGPGPLPVVSRTVPLPAHKMKANDRTVQLRPSRRARLRRFRHPASIIHSPATRGGYWRGVPGTPLRLLPVRHAEADAK